jgi:hypothetical protein
MPEENKKILIFTYSGDMELAFFNKKFHTYGDYNYYHAIAVSHWMPLPEEPKE